MLPHSSRTFLHTSIAGRGRGFTLLELVISISIIVILLGILVATLPAILGSAGAIKSMANLRQISQSFAEYSHANRERFPFYEVGSEVQWGFEGDENALEFSFSPVWLLDRQWPVLFHEIAPWHESFQVWLSPGVPESAFRNTQPGHVSYHYSNSFLGSPSIWSGSAAATPSDIRPTLRSEVRHPSAKALLFDDDVAYLKSDAQDVQRPVAACDGSVRTQSDARATQPVSNPLFNGSARRYHDTPAGIHGKDW